MQSVHVLLYLKQTLCDKISTYLWVKSSIKIVLANVTDY